MEDRSEPNDSLDFFPTPPWATRALIEHVLMPEYALAPEIARMRLRRMAAWDPACGMGDMSRPLAEYFGSVLASDIFDYGIGAKVTDFLFGEPTWPADFIVTNPPFKSAERFIQQAFAVPGWKGIAMLVRTSFLESVGRYEKLFKVAPPSIVAQFTERVPMVKGRLTATGSTATAYCWLVWLNDGAEGTRFTWIQPCRRSLERPGDYPSQSEPSTASPEELAC
ncbi:MULTISPECIES: methyltransferase [unclassified Bradyrhizobium]|uniref:methyltransferase n=1 Tax=unclassified Bradyrhizobium TaxID=2631580 RepID=UPI00339A3FDC